MHCSEQHLEAVRLGGVAVEVLAGLLGVAAAAHLAGHRLRLRDQHLLPPVLVLQAP